MGFFLKCWKSLEKKALPNALKHSAQVVAVDIGQTHLRVLATESRLGKIEISQFRLEPRPASLDALSERLNAIFKETSLDPRSVRTALKGQGVVIRFLTFPQMKKEDFASAIHYEIEKYIPFKVGEVILDFQILKERIPRGDTQVMDVLLVAVKQSEVYQLLKVLQNGNLTSKVVDINALAFSNFIESMVPKAKEGTVGFIDMGTETTTLGILSRGLPAFIREVSFGGADILKLVKRKINLEADAVFQMLKERSQWTEEFRVTVDQAVRVLLSELNLSLAYYSDRVAGAQPVESLLIVGGGSRFIPDLGLFETELKIPVRRPDIFSRVGIQAGLDEAFLRKNEDLLAVALGLCLRP